MSQINEILRPDSKGRVTLGKLSKGISSYHATLEKGGRIILEPYIEIPLREKWLLNNKAALKQVQKGLEDSSQGKVRSKGKFAQYLNDKD